MKIKRRGFPSNLRARRIRQIAYGILNGSPGLRVTDVLTVDVSLRFWIKMRSLRRKEIVRIGEFTTHYKRSVPRLGGSVIRRAQLRGGNTESHGFGCLQNMFIF